MLDQAIPRPIRALTRPAHAAPPPAGDVLRRLCDTIRAFGFATPVLIDRTGAVLAGQGRVEAARLLGLSEVPCLSIETLGEADRHAYLLAQHRLALEAGWDEALLASEIQGLFEAEGAAPARPGQDPREDLLPREEDGEPISRAGDLWRLGPHRLLCADALDPGACERLLGGEMADMVFADAFGRARGEPAGFLRSVLARLAAHACDGSVHFVCADWRRMGAVLAAGEAVYGALSDLIVWVKDPEGESGACGSGHELVFVFEKRDGSCSAPGWPARRRRDVWRHRGVADLAVDGLGEALVVPVLRPVSLVAEAIEESTGAGSVVADAYCGPGTVLIAAHRTGRLGRGLEADGAACDRAVRRWQAYAGEAALLADTGESFQTVQIRRKGGAR